MSLNREFKSTLFATLFDDKDTLLDLYNAVADSDLPKGTPVEIATLDDILFTDRRNDIAFVLDDKIVILVEHQSSLSENMPLRLLIYLARVYEKLIDNTAIYKRKLLKIPKPDFIVLYNGTAPFPDEAVLRLSDAYREIPETSSAFGGSLELEVRVVNINEGRNESMVRKCETLDGYIRFVGKARAYQRAGQALTNAVTQTIRDCIHEGILADFLKAHASEVINMLTTEWNIDTAREVWMQEAREEGLEEGLEKGLKKGRKEGRKKGREEGVELSAKIMSALIEKTPVEEIASRFRISVKRVERIKSLLDRQKSTVAEPVRLHD